MAKATAKQSIQVSRLLGLGAAPVLTGVEAASQTFKKGAPLKNSSGKLAIAAEDDVATLLIGIAEHDAAGVTDTAVKMVPVLPNVVFCAELSDETDGLVTLAQTHMWGKYGINVTTDGKWYVDTDETTVGTNVAAVVVGFRDPVGTVNGIVEFVFKQLTPIWA